MARERVSFDGFSATMSRRPQSTTYLIYWECVANLYACAVQRTNRQRARFAARGASMTRTAVAILCSLAVAACTSAPMPATWTRTDGQASDPSQLESAKTICRGEMEQAQLVTNARGLVSIHLP